MKHDPRVTLWRDGVAARSLEGILEAEVYLDPKAMGCAAPSAAIRAAPDPGAEQVDQLLFGERFEVLEEEGAWLFGQAARDGYVGFVEAAALQPAGAMPTHRVAAIRTYAFAEASIKSRALLLQHLEALAEQELVHLLGVGVGARADAGGRGRAAHGLRVEIDLGFHHAFQAAGGHAVAPEGDTGIVLHAKRSRIMR